MVRLQTMMSDLRSFLSQRIDNLSGEIHVRRLLLSPHLRGVLTPTERKRIENEREEKQKCELYLQLILLRDNPTVQIFFDTLQTLQPTLQIFADWQCYDCYGDGGCASSASKPTREPTESSDYSQVEVKDSYKSHVLADNTNPGPINNFNILPTAEPAALRLGTLDGRAVDQPTDEGSNTAAKLISCLTEHTNITDCEKDMINQVVETEKCYQQKLVDFVGNLVREQRVSPLAIQLSLNASGLTDIASCLVTQTIADKYLDDIPIDVWTKLTQLLSVKTSNIHGDTWKRLPSALGISDEINIDFFEQTKECPAESVLRVWKQKRSATVFNLYKALNEIGASKAADLLVPLLQVSEVGESLSRSVSMCSSNSDNELVSTSLNFKS